LLILFLLSLDCKYPIFHRVGVKELNFWCIIYPKHYQRKEKEEKIERDEKEANLVVIQQNKEEGGNYKFSTKELNPKEILFDVYW